MAPVAPSRLPRERMSPRTRKDVPNPTRCTWAEGDPVMEKYHDEEWGFPVRTTRKHFEQLTLEIFQAGLSWRTILHKREAFRKEFMGFAPEKVARFTEKDIERILGNPGVVRNRKKIEATIENARRFLAIKKKHGSFNRYLASLPDDLPSLQKIFRAEFVFMGPKIAEAYLESVGRIPEPHDPRCWRAIHR